MGRLVRIFCEITHGFLGVPGVGGISHRGMVFWACPAWDAFRIGGWVSGRARRGMHHASGDAVQGVPGVGAFRIGGWVSGRARRGRHFASGHAFLGVPAEGCISLRGMPGVRCISHRGMVFWACPARDAFLGAPGEGCISLRGMPGVRCISHRAWFSGRARREMHFTSGHWFQGVPGVG